MTSVEIDCHWNAFEQRLIKEQQQARNLTTFQAYPFPGRLVEIPYPLDVKDCVVAPELLFMYARSHRFPTLRCFHGYETKLVVSKSTNGGPNIALITCGVVKANERQCGYHIHVNYLLSTGFVECCRYAINLGGFSSESSDGYSTPESMPSLEPSTDNARMPYPMADVVFTNGSSELVVQPDTLIFKTDANAKHHLDRSMFELPIDYGIEHSTIDDMEEQHDSVMPYLGELGARSGLSPDTNVNLQCDTSHYFDHSAFERDNELANLHPTLQYGNDIPSSPPHAMLPNNDNAPSRGTVELVVGRGTEEKMKDPFLDATRSKRRRCKSLIGADSSEGSRRRGGIYDDAAYPLLARRDGICSIATCLDPDTHDFNDGLFLSQIIKDSQTGNISY